MSAQTPSDAGTAAEAVIWHDLECSYEADLDVWSELSYRYGTRVLELGCGTGRVALRLAASGAEVTALDRDPVLLHALRERAVRRGLTVATIEADATEYRSEGVFDLVLAPMQLMQLLAGSGQRLRVLERARSALRLGGAFAAALAQPPTQAAGDQAPLPDMCEHDGWVYSSLPIAVRSEGTGFAIERLRQLVSPSGAISQSQVTMRLDLLSPGELEQDAARVGFRVCPRRQIPATEAHVPSTACVLEAI